MLGVVFLDHGAVRDDVGSAGDGSPFTAGVQEGHVDVGVALDVVGLARLGVGVEEDVDAAGFLF